jgi:hypothetical protein
MRPPSGVNFKAFDALRAVAFAGSARRLIDSPWLPPAGQSTG